MQSHILSLLKEHINVMQSMYNNEKFIGKINKLAIKVNNKLLSGGKLFFAGNGGSFSDASHIAAEFIGRFEKDREPIPAICLASNHSTTTAISNDYGYSNLFIREFTALATKKDFLIVLSTSGNSKNIVKLVECAIKLNIDAYALSGKDGGVLKQLVPSIVIPSNNTARIQEAHITIGHMICSLTEKNLK